MLTATLPVPTIVAPSYTETPVPTSTIAVTASPTLSTEDWLARQNPIAKLAWSTDGKRLAVTALSGVYIFDAQTSAIIYTLEEGEFLFPLAMDPAGGRLFAENKVWDVSSGQVLYSLPQPNVSSVVFSPNGKTLVTGDSNGVTLWDAQTGELQKSLEAGFGDAQWGLAYSPDGNLLYAVSSDHSVKRMDLVAGEFSQLFSLPEDSCCVVFSSDIEYMIVNRPSHGAGSKQLWDVERGELIKDSGNCDTDVAFAAFSPNSEYFTIGPCMSIEAQLWSTATQQLLHSFQSGSLIELRPEWRSAAFGPDGTKLALANDMGEVLIWDVNSYELVNKLSIPLTSPLPSR
ncbi:MAG TPA: WD40 repeat domain-containing protein [Anaerolineales bacterium]|nr:WD40 repeat domain-containing protein [Anaerolineales bacterium]